MAKKRYIDDLDNEYTPKDIHVEFSSLDKTSKIILTIVPIALVVMFVLIMVLGMLGVLGEALKDYFESRGLLTGLTLLLVIIIATGIISLITLARNFLRREKVYRESFATAVKTLSEGDYDICERESYKVLDEVAIEYVDQSRKNASNMMNTCDHLQTQLDRTCDERDDYQFRMISARMSPAMVERAVRKIQRVSEARGLNDISLFSDNLCTMLNSSLRASKQPVALADELSNIKRYIELDDAITGKKTEYRLSVMCNIVNYKIIPHLILPVVENFLEYSDRGKNARYELSVEVSSSANGMIIIVKDNGAGIDVDELEKIQNEINDSEIDLGDDALSLSSINRRIGLCYGEKYGLKVTSSRLGTNVRITLPSTSDFIRSE